VGSHGHWFYHWHPVFEEEEIAEAQQDPDTGWKGRIKKQEEDGEGCDDPLYHLHPGYIVCHFGDAP